MSNPERTVDSLKDLHDLMAEAGFPDAFAYELHDMNLHPEQFDRDIEKIRDELEKRRNEHGTEDAI